MLKNSKCIEPGVQGRASGMIQMFSPTCLKAKHQLQCLTLGSELTLHAGRAANTKGCWIMKSSSLQRSQTQVTPLQITVPVNVLGTAVAPWDCWSCTYLQIRHADDRAQYRIYLKLRLCMDIYKTAWEIKTTPKQVWIKKRVFITVAFLSSREGIFCHP